MGISSNKSLDLLPDSEKQEVESILKKNKRKAQDSEMRLVIPKVNDVSDNKKFKNLSWWARRKQMKEEKRKEKLRKAGEIGVATTKKTQQVEIDEPKKEKPALFGDSLKKTPKPEQPKIEPKPVIKPPQMLKVSEPITPPKPEFKPIVVEKPKQEVPKSVVPVKLNVPVIKDKPIQKVQPEKSPMISSKSQKPVEASEKHQKVTADAILEKMHEPESESKYAGPRVNLVSAEVGNKNYWVFGGSALILVLAVWVIVGGIAVSTVKKAEAQVVEKNANLTQLNVAISNYEEGKQAALKLQEQFKAVASLINKHIYWTLFLQKLEETTIPDVYYVSISANDMGEVTLRAIAKNYDSAARQIRAFESAPQFIKSVAVNSAQIENQPKATLPVPIVAFEIVLKISDDVLYLPKVEEVSE